VRGLAREYGGRFVETPEEAAEILVNWIQPGDLVLFKASRGVRLERTIDALPKFEEAAR